MRSAHSSHSPGSRCTTVGTSNLRSLRIASRASTQSESRWTRRQSEHETRLSVLACKAASYVGTAGLSRLLQVDKGNDDGAGTGGQHSQPVSSDAGYPNIPSCCWRHESLHGRGKSDDSDPSESDWITQVETLDGRFGLNSGIKLALPAQGLSTPRESATRLREALSLRTKPAEERSEGRSQC